MPEIIRTPKKGLCPIEGCGKVFAMGHGGIDAHVVHHHAGLFIGETPKELYADFQEKYPRPWPLATGEVSLVVPQDTRSSTEARHPGGDEGTERDDSDSLLSTYREKLMEHIFIAELLQEAWVNRGRQVIDVLRSEIDASGFDVVLEWRGITRHIQLKATRKGRKVRHHTVNLKLGEKPAGCVVWMVFEENKKRGRLELEYHFFGGGAGEPLPPLDGYPVARRATHRKDGVRPVRLSHREVPPRDFIFLQGGISDLLSRLFEK